MSANSANVTRHFFNKFSWMNLVLLESLTRDVQWQILRVDSALDKVQPLWHEYIAIIQDEDTADVQLGADVW